jgi:hypothetical protein
VLFSAYELVIVSLASENEKTPLGTLSCLLERGASQRPAVNMDRSNKQQAVFDEQ